MSPTTEATGSIVSVEASCVQRLLKPDPAVNSERRLFFHGKGHIGYDTQTGSYFALRGSELNFNSYFNAFPAHLFELQNRQVSIELQGAGDIVAEVMLARHDKSWDRLINTRISLRQGEGFSLMLPDVPLDGVIFFSLYALTDTEISDVDFIIHGQMHRSVELTAVITTFKRNDAVQRTGMRLQEYFENNGDLKKSFKLLVIDNGGETVSIPFESAEVINNPNLGGAGGFTRGLKIASERGWASHVLFMDDDANFFPESIRRTISLLRFTSTPNLAISGAMITEAHKWRMWENAATFNQKCSPIDLGTDLRNPAEIIKISHAQPRKAKNKYGGWWYFCFPLKSLDVWPFPFFVRGDDSYFSLANNFEIVTMLGVAAHQEDFFSKQSPLTVYLDVRYHLVHHLTFSAIKLSPKALIGMASRYFYRFNNSYHYDSAAAINLAIKDVLAGKQFWDQNADMSARRMILQEMSIQERVEPKLELDIGDTARHSPKRNKSWFAKLLRKWTFNGHLLPVTWFYRKGVIFPLHVRAIEHDTFRRKYTVTADLAKSTGYVCTLNRKRYFANLKEFRRLCAELRRDHGRLLIEYAQAKNELTSPAEWERRFGTRGQ